MRETKVQKIARLEKKIEEQKKEMTEIKKDRKRLNYAVERLERKIQKLSAQSSKEDIERMKELNAQIKQMEQSVAEKEEEWNKKEKRLQQQKENAEQDLNYYKGKLITVREQIRNELESEYDGYVNETIKGIVNFRKGKPDKIGNLSHYRNGDNYYNEEINGVEREMPIFSTSDLFIQIHPKTGRPLTDIHFRLLKEWANLNFDYLQFYSPYEEWLNRNKMVANQNDIVSTAYEVGKKILPFYEHLLF